MRTVDNKGFVLRDLKGKVVLVNLWGIWCGPCRQQIVELAKLQSRYPLQEFEIIGINIGDIDAQAESERNIKLFSASAGIKYTNATVSKSDLRSVYTLTGYEVVPQSILIDRMGRFSSQFIGSGPRINEDIKNSVDKLLAD